MTENEIKDIIATHKEKGNIEDFDAVTIIEGNLVKLNKYTLRLSKIKNSSIKVGHYNAILMNYLKMHTNLFKEIREFIQLFKFFEKMNINKGYIKKTETPDFELYKDGLSYGIEVTRLYTGNDWVAEKIHNDISAYKLSSDTFKDYIAKSKYSSRIRSYFFDGKVKVSAKKNAEFEAEEIVFIKNKIFDKIRKLMDDYQKFDINYIFAEIVYSGYKEISSYEDLNNELKFFVSHLDVNFGKNEVHLVLKNGNVFVDFDIKNGTFTRL